jgi:hypothetical protein
MSQIHYLLDEHIEHPIRSAIHRQSADIIVWMIGDPGAPGLGTPDPDILSWCEAHNFSLVTRNRRSMPGHLEDHLAAGRHVPGIFVLNPRQTLAETVTELVLIAGAMEAEECRDQIFHLPLSS